MEDLQWWCIVKIALPQMCSFKMLFVDYDFDAYVTLVLFHNAMSYDIKDYSDTTATFQNIRLQLYWNGTCI